MNMITFYQKKKRKNQIQLLADEFLKSEITRIILTDFWFLLQISAQNTCLKFNLQHFPSTLSFDHFQPQ